MGDDGQIVAVEPRDRPADVDLLTPGFVDLQVNGFDDVDVATADAAGWSSLCRALATQGVTAWCPTLITAPLQRLRDRVETVAAWPSVAGGAVAVGVHLEGPFLGGSPGAHQPVSAADDAIDLDWLRQLPASVAIMTLGPERPNAVEAIRLLRERGVVVALGHTGANEAEVRTAADAGATLFTHGFNAAGPLHHRDPGAMGAALIDDRLAMSLIADGVHVHPTMLSVAWRTKPGGRVALISDAVGWRTERLGDAGIEVRDGAPRLADGTLAGSSLTLPEAIRRCVDEVGVSLADAIGAATAVPAALLGLTDRGQIVPGRRADVVALTAEFSVEQTWIAGRPVS